MDVRNPKVSAEYTNNGVKIGDTLFRFAQGNHITKLMRLLHSSRKCLAPIADLFTERISSHAKELTESMGVWEALVRFMHDSKLNLHKMGRINVYVPGDGKTPRTAALVYMQSSSNWQIYSIDPSMNTTPASLGVASTRLHPINGLAEDFIIPPDPVAFSVVLAVHTHAPLQEFWDRVPRPKVCVSLPCCADYGWLNKNLYISYSDYEIFSKCKHINIYYDP